MMCDYMHSLAGDKDVNNHLSGLSITDSMEKGSKSGTNGKSPATRGQVNRFGFKRPTPPSPQLPSVPPSPADINVQETIEPLVIAPVLPKSGTPRLSRARKEGKAPNRFGFIPPANQLSNKVADLQGSQENLRPPTAIKLGGARSQSETRYKSVDGKVITSSKLPQHTLQRPLPYHHHSNDSVMCSPAAGKMAKTAANNHTLRASNNGNVAEGVASRLKRNEEVMEIRQLEQSPGAAKFRQSPAQAVPPPPFLTQKERNLPVQLRLIGSKGQSAFTTFRDLKMLKKFARPMEMVFSTPKRFELRDLPPSGGSRSSQETPTRGCDSDIGVMGLNNGLGLNNGMVSPAHNMSVNERIRREVVGLPPRYPPSASSMTSSVMSTSSVLSPDTGDEEKLARDTRTTEKMHPVADDVPSEEDLWGGPGEAMALEDELQNADLADLDRSPETMNPPLRSVLLTIEDPTFATLAALSNAGLLEDETAPDSPDISDSSPSSVEPLPPPPPNISSKPGSPHSPGTPTHASNSSSSDTKDRDFLIDDEIADQPGLVFGTGRRRDDEQTIILDRARTLAHIAGDVSQALHNSLHRDSHGGSAGSISTLSPCESLASDDLMADFDISALDDLNDVDDAHIKSEIMNQSDQVIKEWSSLLSSHPGLSSGLRKTPRPRLRSATRATGAVQGDASPLTHTSPRRQPRRIETRSPGDDKSDDSGIKLKKDTWQHMYQDVINIKGVLNELKRALGQPETSTAEEDVANKGPGGTHDHHFPGEDGLHLDDLRRQITLLELENEEKDLKIKRLEEQLKAAFEARPAPPPRSANLPKLANISTQTDRVRPVTTLFHNSPTNATASIVSSSENEKAGLRYHRRAQLSAPLYKVS